jgi:hypothetical protein
MHGGEVKLIHQCRNQVVDFGYRKLDSVSADQFET